MSTTLTKEQKARARSFVAGLKKLKKAIGFRNNTELAYFIQQPATTVKGWFQGSIPKEEKMLEVSQHIAEEISIMEAEVQAMKDFLF